MRTLRRHLSLWVAAVLVACGESKGVEVVRLEVSAAGEYSLKGVPVSRESLAAKLTELNKSSIELQIAAHHLASHQTVVAALEAAKAASIVRIAFVPPEASQK